MYVCMSVYRETDSFLLTISLNKPKKIHNRSEGKKVICECVCVCVWKLQKLSLIKNRKQNHPNEDKKTNIHFDRFGCLKK